MTTIKIPTFHPDSAKDSRLFIETTNHILGYCPRNQAALEQTKSGDRLHLREPMTVVEFLVDVCPNISKSGRAALYLAAKAIIAQMNGDEAKAQELEALHARLVSAEKTTNEVIEQSGVNKAIDRFYEQQEVPF